MDEYVLSVPLVLFSILFYVRCHPIRRDALGRIRLRFSKYWLKAIAVAFVALPASYGSLYFKPEYFQDWLHWTMISCLMLIGMWILIVENVWHYTIGLLTILGLLLFLPFVWLRPIRTILRKLIASLVNSFRTVRLLRHAQKEARRLRHQLEVTERKYGPTYSRLGGVIIDWEMVYRACGRGQN